MPYELARALLLAEAVTPDGLARALDVSVRERVSIVRALLALGVVDRHRLARELAKADAPVAHRLTALPELVRRLPVGMCERLLAVPVRRDPRGGAIDVAVADAWDSHAAEEIAFALQAKVRIARAPLARLEEILAAPPFAAPSNVRPFAAPDGPPVSPTPPLEPPGRTLASTPLWGTPIATITEPPPTERDAAPPALDEAPPAEMPIPLARKVLRASLQPDFDGLARSLEDAARDVDTRRAIDDDDEPIVELRRTKPAPLAAVAPADDRDALLGAALAAVAEVASKAALFVVRRDGYVGWGCTPALGDTAALPRIRIDLGAPTFLGSAARAGAYVGPLLRDEAHAPLGRVMNAPEGTTLAAKAIRVGGRPALVLVAVAPPDVAAAVARLDEVAAVAGDALERIVRAKRS